MFTFLPWQRSLCISGDGKVKREMVAVRCSVSSVAGSVLCWTVRVKRELSWQNQLICVPSLNYGHVLWVVTKRMRLRIQAAEIYFLRLRL